MSTLTFRRDSGQIVLTAHHRLIGIWDAHNDVTSKSAGLWPDGKYSWSHAGRTVGKPFEIGGRTLGCIRVPTEAMSTINDVHRRDPLKAIEVTK